MSTEPHSPLSKPRSMRWFGLLGAVYCAAHMASLLLSVYRNGWAVFCFSQAIGAVALLAVPKNQWPRVGGVLGMAALLAHVGVGLAGGSWQIGSILPQLALPATLALFEVGLAAALLQRWGGIQRGDLYLPPRLVRLLFLGAFLPALATAPVAAMLHLTGPWTLAGEVAATWLMGHLIGNVAALPLALALWLRGVRELRVDLTLPQSVSLLLLSVGVTLMGAATLPHPFVVMIIPIVLLALNAGFAVTALANLLMAVLVVALLGAGVLLAPPSAAWWGDVLYYAAILAALIPGLFLASSVEGREAVLRQITANEQRNRKLYEDTPAMLHSADASRSLGGPILSVSERWLQVTGYQRDEVIGHRFTEFLTPETKQFALDVAIPQILTHGQCQDFEGQLRARDGRILDILFSAVLERDAEGQPVRTYAVLQDITEKKRLAAKSHFAEHDALTGLPNRVLLNDRLERICAQHERNGGNFAVGFLDLDHFKEINDRHGHEAGDYLLRAVAQRLLSSLRAADTVCRVGGDEFVLLLSSADGADLGAVATKVLHQVAQPLVLENESGKPEVSVSASLGLAIYPQHGRNPQSLLQRADEAMYQSKRAGRNRCTIHPG